MRFDEPITVKELAKLIDAEVIGDIEQWAHGINEIHKVQPGDVTFVDIEKYYTKSLKSAAGIIIINKKVACPPGKTLLVTDDPFSAYNNLMMKFRRLNPLSERTSSSAKIHHTAIIEPQVVIGNHVTIGAGSYIQGNCYIGSHTTIGERVIIQAGTIIGTDAFYFKERDHIFEKWHSGGDVIIEDDVFIGAGCTINRGVSGSTIIGRGSKLDSQVHLGHGVELGENCLVAGQTGIGGKTKIGNRVKIYGQAGIANNISVGDDTVILARSGVLKSLAGGKTYFGLPAEEARQKFMEIIAVRNLVRKSSTQNE